jgi:hypothetical protein
MAKPIPFKEANVVFAKDQVEYLPLPAFKEPRYDIDPSGSTISCWKFSIWERIHFLFTGKMWVRQLTFWQALQPQSLQVQYPFTINKENP